MHNCSTKTRIYNDVYSYNYNEIKQLVQYGIVWIYIYIFLNYIEIAFSLLWALGMEMDRNIGAMLLGFGWTKCLPISVAWPKLMFRKMFLPVLFCMSQWSLQIFEVVDLSVSLVFWNVYPNAAVNSQRDNYINHMVSPIGVVIAHNNSLAYRDPLTQASLSPAGWSKISNWLQPEWMFWDFCRLKKL